MKRNFFISGLALITFITLISAGNANSYDINNINPYGYRNSQIYSVNTYNKPSATSIQNDEIVKKYETVNMKAVKNCQEEFREKMSRNGIPAPSAVDLGIKYSIKTAVSMMEGASPNLYQEIMNSWWYGKYGENYIVINSEVSLNELYTKIVGPDKRTIKGLLYDSTDEVNRLAISMEVMYDNNSRPYLSHIWVAHSENLAFLYTGDGKLEGYLYNGKAYPENSLLLKSRLNLEVTR